MQIATTFGKIFDDPDLKTTTEDEQNHEELINQLKDERRIAKKHRITMRELERALKKANNKSASGVDGIPNRLLKEICSIENNKWALLTAINNDIMDEGRFPSQMKIAKIKPIPKTTPGEYRP